MAHLSPYLKLLLGRSQKLQDNDEPLPDEIDAPEPLVTLRQQTIPGSYGSGASQPQSQQLPPSQPAPVALAPRPPSRVDAAAEDVRKYDQGLHKDPHSGDWVVHKRNRGLEVLEGVGTVAAGMFGVPLQRILHPRGTPESRARRTLADEQSNEAVELRKRGMESEINKDDAYSEHLKRLEEQANVRLNRRDEAKPAREHNPLMVELKNRDGSTTRKQSDDYGKTWREVEGLGDAAPLPKPDKPEKQEADATPALGELESGFRNNEKAARAKAEQLESEIDTTVQQKQIADKNYDPAKDTHLQRLLGESKRQRAIEADQRKRADNLAVKKVEAGAKVKSGGAQRWSKSRWAAANPDGDVDAALRAAKAKGYQVVN